MPAIKGKRGISVRKMGNGRLAFKAKYGYWPDREECGDCHRPKTLHRPGGFQHSFVPTGREYVEPHR